MLKMRIPDVTIRPKKMSLRLICCLFGTRRPMKKAAKVADIALEDRSNTLNKYGRSYSAWKYSLWPTNIKLEETLG